MINLEIQHISQHSPIPEDKLLQQWVSETLAARISQAEITLRIVDIEEMQQLNCYYRGKNKPTNVLSFPMPTEEEFIGDIVICAPIVMQEALQQNKHWQAHWAHLVIHGCLHLLGFDHETEEQAAVMEPLEIELLSVLGYQNPYTTGEC
jgi:probable rRNA maturation factor